MRFRLALFAVSVLPLGLAYLRFASDYPYRDQAFASSAVLAFLGAVLACAALATMRWVWVYVFLLAGSVAVFLLALYVQRLST